MSGSFGRFRGVRGPLGKLIFWRRVRIFNPKTGPQRTPQTIVYCPGFFCLRFQGRKCCFQDPRKHMGSQGHLGGQIHGFPRGSFRHKSQVEIHRLGGSRYPPTLIEKPRFENSPEFVAFCRVSRGFATTQDPGRTLLLTRASPGLPVVARQTPSNYN